MNKNFQSAFETYVEEKTWSTAGVTIDSTETESPTVPGRSCSPGALCKKTESAELHWDSRPERLQCSANRNLLTAGTGSKRRGLTSLQRRPQTYSCIQARRQEMRLRFLGGTSQKKLAWAIATTHRKSATDSRLAGTTATEESPECSATDSSVPTESRIRRLRQFGGKRLWSIQCNRRSEMSSHRVVVRLSRLRNKHTPNNISSVTETKDADKLTDASFGIVNKSTVVPEAMNVETFEDEPEKTADDPNPTGDDMLATKGPSDGSIEPSGGDNDKCGTEELMENDKVGTSESREVESTSESVSQSTVERRPRRTLPRKKLDTAVGLSWREERELKLALYASLQRQRLERKQQQQRTAVRCSDQANTDVSSGAASNTTQQQQQDCNSLTSTTPSKTSVWQVRAQRKFASNGGRQTSGSNGTSTNGTSGSNGTSSSASSGQVTPDAKCRPSYTPRRLFAVNNNNAKVTTEDFLTFLCMRGSHRLPPHLEFFNHQESSLLSSFPNTPQDSADGSQSSEMSATDGDVNGSVLPTNKKVSTPTNSSDKTPFVSLKRQFHMSTIRRQFSTPEASTAANSSLSSARRNKSSVGYKFSGFHKSSSAYASRTHVDCRASSLRSRLHTNARQSGENLRREQKTAARFLHLGDHPRTVTSLPPTAEESRDTRQLRSRSRSLHVSESSVVGTSQNTECSASAAAAARHSARLASRYGTAASDQSLSTGFNPAQPPESGVSRSSWEPFRSRATRSRRFNSEQPLSKRTTEEDDLERVSRKFIRSRSMTSRDSAGGKVSASSTNGPEVLASTGYSSSDLSMVSASLTASVTSGSDSVTANRSLINMASYILPAGCIVQSSGLPLGQQVMSSLPRLPQGQIVGSVEGISRGQVIGSVPGFPQGQIIGSIASLSPGQILGIPRGQIIGTAIGRPPSALTGLPIRFLPTSSAGRTFAIIPRSSLMASGGSPIIPPAPGAAPFLCILPRPGAGNIAFHPFSGTVMPPSVSPSDGNREQLTVRILSPVPSPTIVSPSTTAALSPTTSIISQTSAKHAKKKRVPAIIASYIKPRRKRRLTSGSSTDPRNNCCGNTDSSVATSPKINVKVEEADIVSKSDDSISFQSERKKVKKKRVFSFSTDSSTVQSGDDSQRIKTRPSTRSQTAAVIRHELIIAQMKTKSESIASDITSGNESKSSKRDEEDSASGRGTVQRKKHLKPGARSTLRRDGGKVVVKRSVPTLLSKSNGTALDVGRNIDIPVTLNDDRMMRRYLRKRNTSVAATVASTDTPVKHSEAEFVVQTFLRIPEFRPGRTVLRTGPTYRPSPDQFQEPLSYISSIKGHAGVDGICRIVPPSEGWKLESHLASNVCLSASQQLVHCLQQQTTIDNSLQTTPTETLTLSEFHLLAESFMSSWFPFSAPSVEEIEQKFWEIVEQGRPSTVVRSAVVDTPTGSAFPSSRDTPYSKHEWNFNVLQRNPESLLTHLAAPVAGVNIPTLEVGMLFSSCRWSRNQHFLPSIHYMHSGADIVWYCINGKDEKKLKHVVIKMLSAAVDLSAPNWLSKCSLMVSPEKLVQSGISVSRIVQSAGEFVVVFPQSFVSRVCCGHCVDESLSFAPVDWFPLGCTAAQMSAASCLPDCFSLDELILSISRRSPHAGCVLNTAADFVKTRLEEELKCRVEIIELGAKHSGMLPDADRSGVRQQNRRSTNTTAAASGAVNQNEISTECKRCHHCHKLCYLSMVSSQRDGHTFCLQHAIECLRSTTVRAVDFKLFVRCDEKELNDIIATKLTSPTSSVTVGIPRRSSHRKTPRTTVTD